MNFKILETDINIEEIKQEILSQPQNWHSTTWRQTVNVLRHTESIPLVVPDLKGVPPTVPLIESTDITTKTMFFPLYPKTTHFLKTRFKNNFARAMIAKILPNGEVYDHIDYGYYYEKKDRHHLVIQGSYRLTVEDESIVANPGMLFTFNNKKMHNAKNLLDSDRISIIVDIPAVDGPPLWT